MKTKTKIYSLMLGVFFVGMFFARIDKLENSAEAQDCYSLCADTADEQGCYNECVADSGDSGWGDTSGSGSGYEYTQDMCDQYYGPGYVPNSDKTGCEQAEKLNFNDGDNMDNFPTNNPTDKNGNSSDSCDPSPSCWFYNCCSSASTNSEPTAEDKKDAAAKKAAAVTLSNILNNAKKNKTAADAILASCAKLCTQEQIDAANKANQALIDAQAAFDDKIAEANAAYAKAYPDTASGTGAGFNVCANGMVAIVCSGGGGTPIVAGIGTGGYAGGGGGYSGGSYGSGGTYNPVKCGTGFSDVGGVCFPMNTGLSEASISQIAFNLFSWLMGLFTTLAVLAFVVSGIQYFMSSGDESMAESAKENAKNAMIGIVVGLSGFIIVKAIAAALSGQSYFF